MRFAAIIVVTAALLGGPLPNISRAAEGDKAPPVSQGALPLNLVVFPVEQNTKASVRTYLGGRIVDLILKPPLYKRGIPHFPAAKDKVAAIEAIQRKKATIIRITVSEPGLTYRLERNRSPELLVLELAPKVILGVTSEAALSPTPLVHRVIPDTSLASVSKKVIDKLFLARDRRHGHARTKGRETTRDSIAAILEEKVLPCASAPVPACRREAVQLLLREIIQRPPPEQRAGLALLLAKFYEEEGLRSEAIAHIEMALETAAGKGKLPRKWRELLGLARATLYLEHDPKKGLSLLKSLESTSLSPGIRLSAGLASAYHILSNGSPAKAKACFSRLLKLWPGNGAVEFGLAEALLVSGSPGRASRIYRKLLESRIPVKGLSLGLLHLRLGDAGFMSGKEAEAAEWYAKASASADKDTADLARLRLMLLRAKKDGLDMVTVTRFRELIELAEGPYSRAAAILATARSLYALGKIEKAWEMYIDLSADPIGRTLSRRLEKETGMLALTMYKERERLGGPMAVCARYIRDHSTFPLVRSRTILEELESLVADSFSRLGFHDDAIQILQNSLDKPGTRKQKALRLARLGSAYLDSGDVYRARATLAYLESRLRRRSAMPVQGLILKARLAIRGSHFEKAVEVLSRAYSLAGYDEELRSDINLMKARALESTGDHEAAIKAYLAAHELYKHVPSKLLPSKVADLRFELADAFKKSKKNKEAAEWFLAAADCSKDHETKKTLELMAAHCFMLSGDREKASALLDKFSTSGQGPVLDLMVSYKELAKPKTRQTRRPAGQFGKKDKVDREIQR